MISIVMSAYNAASTIRRAIDSVISQSITDWELIVIDDGSTDDTPEVVLSYSDDRIILIKHDKNMGAGIARRTGTKNIRGEWMMFLDSDDFISDEYLETLLFTTTIVDTDIVSSGFITIDENNTFLSERVPEFRIQDGWDKFSHDKSDTKRFMNPMLIRSSL